MPRYFFDVYDGASTLDDTGAELGLLAHAEIPDMIRAATFANLFALAACNGFDTGSIRIRTFGKNRVR